MKKFLRVLLICILVLATTCVIACKKSCKGSNPWNPPTNEFGDDKDGGFGSGVGEKPDKDGGVIQKSIIIIE